jgi:DNA-binding NarL/FixJ family response regulator
MIKVGIIDDHTLFRMGLSRLVNSFENCEVTFQAKHGKDLLSKLESGAEADVLLLDLKMPEMGGLEVLDYLTKDYNQIKVLVISMHDDVPFVIEAMKKGAKGYILKDVSDVELKHAIEKVISLGFYLNEKLSKVLIQGITHGEQKKSSNAFVDLTEIELEILENICLGLTSQEIADKIYRSRRTIEGHKQRLLDKTDTKNTPALVAWAFRNGIVE